MKLSITGLCLMLLIVMVSQNAVAQSLDTLRARYNNETLHFFKGQLAKGEEGNRIRLRELKNEFNLSPEGFKQFESYRKKRTSAIVLLGAALASTITGAIIYDDGRRNVDRAKKNLGSGFLLAGYSFEFVSLLHAFSAHKKLHRAIWLRNRDALFSPK